jgi:hypothetical protein
MFKEKIIIKFLLASLKTLTNSKHSGSHAAFGTTFRVTGSYRKAGKPVTRRISQLVRDIIEANVNFVFRFS